MNIKDIKAFSAQAPKTKDSQKIAIFLGVVLSIMAICQLLTLQKFIGILYDFNLFPSYSDTSAFAATLIIFEILAVPFLLRLKLSNGFRATSMIMGWLAILAWVFLSFWMWLNTGIATDQSGLLGGLVPLISGPWIVTFTLASSVAMAWASWGLWPLQPEVTKKIKKVFKKNNKNKKKSPAA